MNPVLSSTYAFDEYIESHLSSSSRGGTTSNDQRPSSKSRPRASSTSSRPASSTSSRPANSTSSRPANSTSSRPANSTSSRPASSTFSRASRDHQHQHQQQNQLSNEHDFSSIITHTRLEPKQREQLLSHSKNQHDVEYSKYHRRDKLGKDKKKNVWEEEEEEIEEPQIIHSWRMHLPTTRPNSSAAQDQILSNYTKAYTKALSEPSKHDDDDEDGDESIPLPNPPLAYRAATPSMSVAASPSRTRRIPASPASPKYVRMSQNLSDSLYISDDSFMEQSLDSSRSNRSSMNIDIGASASVDMLGIDIRHRSSILRHYFNVWKAYRIMIKGLTGTQEAQMKQHTLHWNKKNHFNTWLELLFVVSFQNNYFQHKLKLALRHWRRRVTIGRMRKARELQCESILAKVKVFSILSTAVRKSAQDRYSHYTTLYHTIPQYTTLYHRRRSGANTRATAHYKGS